MIIGNNKKRLLKSMTDKPRSYKMYLPRCGVASSISVEVIKYKYSPQCSYLFYYLLAYNVTVEVPKEERK